MAADEHAFDEEPIPGAMPERWETAIEDAAQVVAIGLDRAQDLADLLNDFARQHPTATKLILAAAGGMIVGSLIAGRVRRTLTVAERSTQFAEEIQSNTRSKITDLSARMPSRRAVLERLPRIDRGAMAEHMPHLDRDALTRRLPHMDRAALQRGRRASRPDLGQMRNAAQLVPVALTLLRNPLVRQLIMRSAVRAARRS